MILSERRGFAFIHNPKCGGSTVRTALMAFDTTANFFWMHDDWNGGSIDKAHLPLYIFRSKYPEYFKVFSECFTFMLVRDPYARAVSGFDESNVELSDINIHLPGGEAAYRQALNDFVCGLNQDAVKGWRLEFRHFVRQVDLAYLGTKSYVDVVMKLEEWPKCLNRLRHFLPDVADLLAAADRLNARYAGRDCMQYLSRASIDRINALYHSDFNVFGYDMV